MMKHKSILLSSKRAKSGVHVVTIGLMSMLKRELGKVAFLKLISDEKENDSDIDFVIKEFKLKQNPKTAYAITRKECQELIESEQSPLIYEKILEKYNSLIDEYDFVLCQGVDILEDDIIIDSSLNYKIAQNLQMPIFEIINSLNIKNINEVKEIINERKYLNSKYNNTLIGLFFNRVPKDIFKQLKEKNIDKNLPIFFLPEVEELSKISINDILSQSDAKLLTKNIKSLDKNINSIKIATMNLENLLNDFKDGDLIISSADRIDILSGILLASNSYKYPASSGVLLCSKKIKKKMLKNLISQLSMPLIPVLLLNKNIEDAIKSIESISSEITINSDRKIALILGLFNRYINFKKLEKNISLISSNKMTPAKFIYMLYQKAQSSKSRILLPESEDERILRAADAILRQGICEITLLGDEEKIHKHCKILGLNLSKAKIINPQNFKDIDKFIQSYYELRKHKGITIQMAKEALSQINYFSIMLLYFGYVDGVVSGATHTTRETIKPAFEIIKTKEGVDLISSLFFMLVNDSVLVYADCAINPDPNPKELAQIAISSAKTAKTFGIEPRVAMLSYSSGNSGVGSDVEKVREATKIAQKLAPDILIEGPMQYDAAVDEKVAAQKMPNSKVAGRATVFIFPDLNTGNNTYKAVQRSTNAIAIGPILQGIKKPVNDLSRGAEVSDIIYTIAVTAIQAKENK